MIQKLKLSTCCYTSLAIISAICIVLINLAQRDSSSLIHNENLNENNEYETNYLNDLDHSHLLWFIQISDLHLSEFHDYSRISDFEYFCNQTLHFIKPRVVLATGDLTDAKDKNLLGSRQFEFEWKTYYRVLLENNVLNVNSGIDWLDVKGNHDNFDVSDWKADNNLFRKYGVRGNHRSYMHEIKLANTSDSYSFIAVDATGTEEPGARRPFNFFGKLTDKDLEQLKFYAYSSQSSNGTIWFGHYPSASIHRSVKFRSVMNNGIAYLCGHLHDIIKQMYTHHDNGLLELELSDWKHNRKFRLMAFDSGLFSFRDVDLWSSEKRSEKKRTNIFTLITNPSFTHRPQHLIRHRIKHSTHIRFLVFSKYKIKSAQVFLNDKKLGEAEQSSSSYNKNLFTIKWTPKELDSKEWHLVKIIVKDEIGQVDQTQVEFSLDPDGFKLFSGFLSGLILLGDQVVFIRFGFYLAIFSFILFFSFFRFTRKRFTVRLVTCGFIRQRVLRYFRRFALLCSIDIVFWYFVLTNIYLAVGPWFIGEILNEKWGIVFCWGIFMLGDGNLLTVDFQYVFGIFHLIFFQTLLIFDLSYKIEISYQNYFSETNLNNFKLSLSYLLKLLWRDSLFFLLTILLFFQIYDIYASYSLISILICPLKTWNLFFVIYLRYFRLSNVKLREFSLNIATTASSNDPPETFKLKSTPQSDEDDE